MRLKHCAIDAPIIDLGQISVMTNKLVTLFALVVMSVCTAAQSQNLVGFDRGSFGSVVLSQTQSAGSELQLELSIGSYENEPIINYRGTIFAEIGRPVGRLDVLTDKGLFPCTAFIVSKKYILTNYHCSLGLLDNEKIGATRIEATQFVAGYVQTGIDEGTNKFTVVPIPVEYSEKLDYAVLEVIGNPSQDYGELKLASMVPNDRTPFWVIGHPQGKGQHISREKCRASSPAVSKTKLLHTCDTLPGNSGSPIIDAGLQVVVALHHAGIANDSVNAAILMSEILENSKVLAAYKAPNDMEQKVLPKAAAITACDALYRAASEAKACYAYEAYLASCKTHSLIAIGRGYIKNYCQPEDTATVDDVIFETCSEAVGKCSNEQLCDWASSDGKWKTSASGRQRYVSEAKRRGLSCGVIATTAKRSIDNLSGKWSLNAECPFQGTVNGIITISDLENRYILKYSNSVGQVATGSAESSGSTIKIFLRYSDGATADATLTANENWDSANGKAADGCILIAKRTN